MRQTAKDNLTKAVERSIALANAKRRDPTLYQKGDYVVIKRPRKVEEGQTKKFVPHYTEPYKVVKKLSDLSYIVKPQGSKERKEEIVHVAKMKRFFPKQKKVLLVRTGENDVTPFSLDFRTRENISVNLVTKAALRCVEMFTPEHTEMASKGAVPLPHEAIYFFANMDHVKQCTSCEQDIERFGMKNYKGHISK